MILNYDFFDLVVFFVFAILKENNKFVAQNSFWKLQKGVNYHSLLLKVNLTLKSRSLAPPAKNLEAWIHGGEKPGNVTIWLVHKINFHDSCSKETSMIPNVNDSCAKETSRLVLAENFTICSGKKLLWLVLETPLTPTRKTLNYSLFERGFCNSCSK